MMISGDHPTCEKCGCIMAPTCMSGCGTEANFERGRDAGAASRDAELAAAIELRDHWFERSKADALLLAALRADRNAGADHAIALMRERDALRGRLDGAERAVVIARRAFERMRDNEFECCAKFNLANDEYNEAVQDCAVEALAALAGTTPTPGATAQDSPRAGAEPVTAIRNDSRGDATAGDESAAVLDGDGRRPNRRFDSADGGSSPGAPVVPTSWGPREACVELADSGCNDGCPCCRHAQALARRALLGAVVPTGEALRELDRELVRWRDEYQDEGLWNGGVRKGLSIVRQWVHAKLGIPRPVLAEHPAAPPVPVPTPAPEGKLFCRECDCVAGNGQRGHHMVYAGFGSKPGAMACAFCSHTSPPVPKGEAFRPTPAAVPGEEPTPHECRCKNAPCPVCGGKGPSGEWFDGGEVECDDCETSLLVTVLHPCHGVSTFTVADIVCPACKGTCTATGEDDAEAPNCPRCDGEGQVEPTIEEARVVAGLSGPAPTTGGPGVTPAERLHECGGLLIPMCVACCGPHRVVDTGAIEREARAQAFADAAWEVNERHAENEAEQRRSSDWKEHYYRGRIAMLEELHRWLTDGRRLATSTPATPKEPV